MRRRHEEIEFGPSLNPEMTPFRRYVDGEVVEQGFGHVNADPRFVEGKCIEYGQPKANGRRDVSKSFTVNSGGSVCHSGANSREYKDGWERIFANRRSGTTEKAN